MLSGNKTNVSNGTNTLITTLGYGNTTGGETWNCTARAFDGNYYSDYSSTTRDIRPTIENVTSTSITNESAVITWDTDVGTNSTVNYNTSLSLGIYAYNASNVTQGHQVALTNINPTTLYYYNVSSCTSNSICSESGPYNFTTNGPPTIENVTNISITNESAVIRWDTDKNSSSLVEYGTNLSLSSSATNATNVSQGHQVLLENLTDSTLYYYNVTSCNAYGCQENGPNNFTTDDKPSISAIVLTPTVAYSSNNLTCNATPTDAKNTTLTVEYYWYNGTQLMVSGNTTGVSNNTNTIITTLGFGNTTAGETWNCTVRAFDGNYYSNYSSTTRTISITMENVTSSSITNESAIISWDTDAATNSTVNYGINLSLGSYSYNSSMIQSHQIYLQNLTPNTLYYYNVSSCTASGACSELGSYNFTTDGPPTIENVTNTSITNESAVIRWDTDKNSSSLVEYGTNLSLSSSATNTTNVSQGHQVYLENLTDSTLYYYNVTSCNAYGCQESGPYNFTTSVTPSTCGLITYDTTLVNDVTSNGSCFTINNNSITLDCAEYSITGNGTGIGINVSGYSGVTLRDCVVTNFSYGIYISNSDSITLINNTPNENVLYDFYSKIANLTPQGNWIVNGTQNTLFNLTTISSGDGIYLTDNSVNRIQNSTFGLSTTLQDTSINQMFSSIISALTVSADSGSNIAITNIGAGTINKNLSSSTNSFEAYLNNTVVSQINLQATSNSLLSVYGSNINTVTSTNSNITIGNYTNISRKYIEGTSIINFTTLSNITSSISNNADSDSIIYGLVDMPSSVTFSGGNLTRFYPTYIVNQSHMPDINRTITIQNSSTVLWNGTTDTNGYIEPNITFTSANYNQTYDIVINPDIGDIYLLLDTPINVSADTAPPNITGYDPIGTLYDPSVTLRVWTDEVAICKYSLTNGTNYSSMNLTFWGTGTSHEFYIGELNNGEKKYYVRCKDISDNICNQFELNFTVSVYYRTGGHYIPTPEPENPKASQFWSSIIEDGSTTMKISNEEIAFTRITFGVDTKLKNVDVAVERLLDEPADTPKPSGIVYQYIQIAKDNLKEEEIETVKIRFKVDRDWLTQNSISPDNIALFKYTNHWVKLHTEKINTETNYVHYEATAPSFSLFAVASTSPTVITPQQPVVQPKPVVQPPEDVVVEKVFPQILPETEEETNTLKIILISTVILVIIIVGAVGITSYLRMSKTRAMTRVEQYLKDVEQPTIDIPRLAKPTVVYPELSNYIKTCLARNMTMTQVRQSLLDARWQEDVVDEAIAKFL